VLESETVPVGHDCDNPRSVLFSGDGGGSQALVLCDGKLVASGEYY